MRRAAALAVGMLTLLAGLAVDSPRSATSPARRAGPPAPPDTP